MTQSNKNRVDGMEIAKPVHRYHYCQKDGECAFYTYCLGEHVDLQYDPVTREMAPSGRLSANFKRYTESKATCFKKQVFIPRSLSAVDPTEYHSSNKGATNTGSRD